MGGIASKRRVRVLLWGAAAWLFIAAFVMVQFWPDLPHTAAGWLLFIALAPPLYIFAEAVGNRLLSRRHGNAISQRKFSMARVFIALPVVLAVFALSWWLSRLLGKA